MFVLIRFDIYWVEVCILIVIITAKLLHLMWLHQAPTVRRINAACIRSKCQNKTARFLTHPYPLNQDTGFVCKTKYSLQSFV